MRCASKQLGSVLMQHFPFLSTSEHTPMLVPKLNFRRKGLRGDKTGKTIKRLAIAIPGSVLHGLKARKKLVALPLPACPLELPVSLVRHCRLPRGPKTDPEHLYPIAGLPQTLPNSPACLDVARDWRQLRQT